MWKPGPAAVAGSRSKWRTWQDGFAAVWDGRGRAVPGARPTKHSRGDNNYRLSCVAGTGKAHRQAAACAAAPHACWCALHGPERAVYFEKEHPPGRQAAIDFTDCALLRVRTPAARRAFAVSGLDCVQPLARLSRRLRRVSWLCMRIAIFEQHPLRRAVRLPFPAPFEVCCERCRDMTAQSQALPGRRHPYTRQVSLQPYSERPA